MSFDLRAFFGNISQSDDFKPLEEQAFRAEIIWTFIFLLHFAALLPLNPVVVHFFVVILDWIVEKARPWHQQNFHDTLMQRLPLDSSIASHFQRHPTVLPATSMASYNYGSYLSTILTHTTSKYNSLRKILLNNEEDGDTEDDSHISRVLRAYYTEKGHPFPPWLPSDPRKQQPAPVQQSSSYFGNPLGARNPYSNAQQPSRPNASLNDLWDTPSQTAPPTQPQSLRAGRRAPAASRQDPAASNLSVPQARPLPSQRAGSYQNTQPQSLGSLGQSGFSVDPNPSPGGTAQDRLRARLWGRGGSSTNVSAPPQPDPYATQPSASNPYDTTNRRYGR